MFYNSNEAEISCAQTRLIYIQLLCFGFLLEMLIRPSNKSCKSLFNRNSNLKISSSFSMLCFIHYIMTMNLKPSLIQVLTYISMLEKHKSIIKKLRITRNYLRISSKNRNQFSSKFKPCFFLLFLLLFLSPFFSSFFLPFFLSFLSFLSSSSHESSLSLLSLFGRK